MSARSIFPTRQVMRRLNLGQVDFAAAAGPNPGDSPLLRFVKGLDADVQPMTLQEFDALGDAFTQKVLKPGANPITLREVITAITAIPDGSTAVRKTYLVAEGAHPRTQGVNGFALNARLAISWHKSGAAISDIMVSASPNPDDPDALLQLAAWSDADGAFHYFERRSGAWIWAGHGFHALESPSRGQGPFDSHVNGSLVMKELKAPWSHWHSMDSSIPPEVFDPGSELATDPLFADLTGAENLERTVRDGVRRWTLSRLTHDKAGTTSLARFPTYLRQVLWTTSVNLVSSAQTFLDPVSPPFALPTSFFIDVDAFEFLASALQLNAPLLPRGALRVDEQLYRDAVSRRNLRLREDDPAIPPDELAGDTQFAFLVPERAHEDSIVLIELVRGEAIGARLALCMLAVDFANPVFSPRRAGLLDHAMDSVETGSGGQDFESRFIAALRTALASGAVGNGPEAELLDWFDLPDPVAALRTRIADYFAALRDRLATQQGVDDVLELASSRRLAFANRKLAEFRSTIAGANNVRPLLAMDERAMLFTKPTSLGETFL